MAVKVPKLDYKDLMETIPDKPSLWKVKQMKSFLEFVNFKNCVEKFGINIFFLKIKPLKFL